MFSISFWPDDFSIPHITQQTFEHLTSLRTLLGAGIVLLFGYSDAYAFGGAICKVIQEDGHANLGENGTVIWALLWAIKMSDHFWDTQLGPDIHVYFHFDSINAGFLAGGYFRTKEFPQLRIIMRSLAQILQGRH